MQWSIDQLHNNKFLKNLIQFDDVILTGGALTSIISYIRAGGAVCIFYEYDNIQRGFINVIREIHTVDMYIVRITIPFVPTHMKSRTNYFNE